jgi:hypothetical protein
MHYGMRVSATNRLEEPVDITVYLPDEIGTRAKEAELPFSRMLRDAVEDELARREVIGQTLSDGIEEHEVDLDDVTGVITGKCLGVTDDGDAEFYLTDDERLLVYDANRQQVSEVEDPEAELGEWIEQSGKDTEVVASVMRKLGLKPRVRL